MYQYSLSFDPICTVSNETKRLTSNFYLYFSDFLPFPGHGGRHARRDKYRKDSRTREKEIIADDAERREIMGKIRGRER